MGFSFKVFAILRANLVLRTFFFGFSTSNSSSFDRKVPSQSYGGIDAARK